MDLINHDRKTGSETTEAFGKADPDAEQPPGKTADQRPQREGSSEGQSPAKDDEAKKDEQPKGPPFYKRPVPMLILGVVLIVGIVGGVLWWLHARQFESTDDAFVDGHVIPISPKVAALVSSVHIDDNTAVKKGDVLIELDPRDFQVVLDQMKAAESSARSKLARAMTQLNVTKANVTDTQAGVTVAEAGAQNTKNDYQRFLSLDERARSKQQLDNATAAERTAVAQVEQAKAKLTAAQAQVADAEQAIKTAEADVQRSIEDVRQAAINLSYCTLIAPEDGRITRKSVEPGQYVQVAQPLFSIVPTNVWVTANFKETQLENMRVGQAVDIKIDAYSDKEFHGKVDSIQNGTGSRFTLLPAENATGNYVKVVQRVPVKIILDSGDTTDPNHLLAPGLSVFPSVRVR